MSTTFRIPKLELALAIFQDKGISSYYDVLKEEERAWIAQYNKDIFGPKMQAFIDRCKFELLACYVWPNASKERLRAGMELLNLFWLYDEFTDDQTGADAQETAKMVRRSLQEPGYKDDSWLCRILQDFCRRSFDNVVSPAFADRFIENFCQYTDRCADEAINRENKRVLDIPDYIVFRRDTAGVYCVLDLVEYCSEIELPKYVQDDPLYKISADAAVDLAGLMNDVWSYNMEQGKGHSEANIITVVMKAKELSIQGAMDFVGGYCESLVTKMVEVQKVLSTREDPAFSKDAVKIIENTGSFLLGYVKWSYVTERYFGTKGGEVEKNGIVELWAPFAEHVGLTE